MCVIKTFESFNDDLGYRQISTGEASDSFLRRGKYFNSDSGYGRMDKRTIDRISSKIKSIGGSDLSIDDDDLRTIYCRDPQSKAGVSIVTGVDGWFYVMWDIRTYDSNSIWYECDGLDAVLKCIEDISKSNSTTKTFESETIKSKKQLKNELWHKNNPDPKGTTIKVEELGKFGIPEVIQDMMAQWPIIYKSPYSKSFYSSDDISWTHKPDKSFRVSDHWNFKTSRSQTIHCKTDKKTPDNTHYLIGQYDKRLGVYKILLSEPTKFQAQKRLDKEKKLKYLQDPDIIYKKKLFKDSVNRGQVKVEFNYYDKQLNGILNKYTGSSIRIVNDKGDVIFSTSEIVPNRIKSLVFKDLNDKVIDNPYNF